MQIFEKILTEKLNGIIVKTFDAVLSTNEIAAEYVKEAAHTTNGISQDFAQPLPALFFAKTQTAGQGRHGKSFFSPAGGLYFSYAELVQSHTFDLSSALPTVRAGVAVSKAIKSVLGLETKIKWVNDIFVDGKKVCGILTKAITYGDKTYLITGIGINWTSTEFPSEIDQTAGSLAQTDFLSGKTYQNIRTLEFRFDGKKTDLDTAKKGQELAMNSAAELISQIILDLSYCRFDIAYYRENCLTIGKTVRFFDTETKQFLVGTATDVDKFGQLVIDVDGKTYTLSQGSAELV